MSTERHRRVIELFQAACELPRGERTAFLQRETAGDASLEQDVRALLQAEESNPDALEPGKLGEQIEGVQEALDTPPPTGWPERIGDYKVLRRIGQGGMGTVFEALQERLRRRVAVKVIATQLASDELRRRFEYESRVLGLLQHPGVAQIHEAGTIGEGEGAQPYFVMEYVDGEPLTAFARRHDLDLRARLELLARVCDAIHHAHQKGIIHRDLKPGNILVTAEGQPKILDFGIARAATPDAGLGTLHTSTGQVIGTLPYMSPEQALGGAHQIDTRSDVYALGVLLYELLSGRQPLELEHKSFFEALNTLREVEPPRLGSLDPELRGDLETIAAKALEKDVERRYASAEALASDIRRFLADEPIAAHPPSTVYQIGKFVRRNRILVAGLMLLMFLLVAGVGVTSWMAAEARLEAEKSSSIVDLFLELFRSAHPRSTRGADFTVRELLDEFSAELESRPPVDPEVEATLRLAVGSAYSGIGLPLRALPHQERAIEILEQTLGEDDKRTLLAMSSHGVSLKRLRRLRAAEAVHRETYSRALRALGDQHIVTLKCLNNLAATLLTAQDLDEAEKFLRRGLAVPEIADDQYHETVIYLKSNLAGILYYRQDYEEAEQLWLETIEAIKIHLPPQHPTMLRALSNLATNYVRHERLDEALPLLEDVVERRRQFVGPDHPETLMSLYWLGETYYRLERYRDAIPVLQAWCESRIGSSEAPSQQRFQTRLWLGRSLRQTGEWDRAERFLREAFRHFGREQGLEGPLTSQAREQLRQLYRATGRAELAEGLEPLPPEPPRGQSPADGATLESLTPTLVSSPFRHELPGARHGRSHWQIRHERGDYERRPVFDRLTESSLSALTVPHGYLLAGERYFWRVRHIATNQVASPFAPERELRTNARGPRPVPVDLTRHFVADIVQDEGDADNDSFDADAGSLLPVEAADGSVQGLPADRRVDVFALGDYARANSIELDLTRREPLSIAVPGIRGTAVRFLVAGGNGRSTVPVRLLHEDGMSQRLELPCPDWFEDNIAQRPGCDTVMIHGGMDRFRHGAFDDTNSARLFAVTFPVESGSPLTSIVLEPREAVFDSDRTRFHLLAVTVIEP